MRRCAELSILSTLESCENWRLNPLGVRCNGWFSFSAALRARSNFGRLSDGSCDSGWSDCNIFRPEERKMDLMEFNFWYFLLFTFHNATTKRTDGRSRAFEWHVFPHVYWCKQNGWKIVKGFLSFWDKLTVPIFGRIKPSASFVLFIHCPVFDRSSCFFRHKMQTHMTWKHLLYHSIVIYSLWSFPFRLMEIFNFKMRHNENIKRLFTFPLIVVFPPHLAQHRMLQ